ncbi:RNA methyltransferase [Gordonia sp. X0973]|uniref:TrmH family RNA methyltransferase n=1 Tax=Gordonia sp. X0973 TaxID=2742602 RepID=UPI000F51EE5A|nr:RNA methyltransferase [Gordonia sp. X0973]QKT07141.1 RNA methyltransferase [Gordonia sp. X0973]
MDVLTERSSRVVSYAKLHRAATRREQGLFLVEGANSVTAAIETGRARVLLVGESAQARHGDLLALAADRVLDVLVITDRAVAKLADSTTPPGIFAVCGLLDTPLDEVLAVRPRLLAVAVEPGEPGNAGTIVRCADAMGADGVVFLGDAVDPHNGKCVRASAGSVFHLPISRERSVDDGLAALRAAGLTLLATTADGELGLPDAGDVLAGPTAWLFGNEAHGLPADVVAAADHRVSIPIRGRAESLNLATAAAICLYESARAQL